MEFSILGAVFALVDDVVVDPGPARQRCVLAALAVDANQVVSVDRLIQRVWGEQPPLRARQTLVNYVSRLRQVLAADTADTAAIVRRSGGYSLAVRPLAIDLHRFRDLRSRALAEDDRRAVALWEEALGLWRGDALTGLDGDWAEAERDRLHRERLDAECDLTDTLLRLGRGEDLVARLSTRVAEHPLDERVAGQYLLALHRAGRTADALAHYRQVRERLVVELGSDPASALQDLHRQILIADPQLTDIPTSSAVAPAVPRQLPAAPAPFVGRHEELDLLDATLRDTSTTTVVISAIAGAGGIGKTWLALHWAHRHADRFPDGQLFVDLRGFGPAGTPMDSTVAVRGFLDALGVEPGRIPASLHAQTGLFRSLVAGKRMLLVLDNAANAAQTTPLLPGSPTCTVVVTSRNQLPGLITGHGAHHVRLDVLSDAEAHTVLTDRLGLARVTAEPAAAKALIGLCGGFPLALSIIAGHLHTRPDLPLAALAVEFRDVGLDVLDDDDPAASLPAVLSWSYQALISRQATVFSLLGIAPGPDIGLPAATSLTGLSPDETRTAVHGLAQASLISQDSRGRLRMHDLVRRYATDTARRLPDEVRDAALRRVVNFYLHTAYTGERILDPHRPPIRLDTPEPGTRPHVLPDTHAAFDWFDTENLNLLAAQHIATTHRWYAAVWQLTWTLTTFQNRRGHSHDQLAVTRTGLAAGRHLDAPAVHILTQRLVGMAYASVGRFDEAVEHLHQALTLAERHDDLLNQARNHRGLAWTWRNAGDNHKALNHATRALDVHRLLDNPVEEALSRCLTACYAALVGDYDRASEHCEVGLLQCRRYGIREGEAAILTTMGYISHHTGHHHRAIRDYHAAITLHRDMCDTYHVADDLAQLGHPHTALGHHDRARAVWQEALELYREQGRDTDAERVRQQLDGLDHADDQPSTESVK
ncbi:DNA-binding SARP family transcriptional activator/tetratricopeptide (TPR) repeat protein [Saccharothrix ecbatanensis]|uniref:DNA-binding SARP family transcriptional activator/tetratricopeptide (TPR) repeat protein n=1 Tax=Saccharothrix ecbatanensis TaxID=1105145 RepID=A0A7W9M0X7_9PSEU|nr:DNA-binding SARP family transcriptional activator/tetratricopeptide (TPR) repeat protein [Saccharothrix ecbatanensis]